MSEFVTIAAVTELQDGQSRRVQAGDKELALFRVGDEFFAIDNECSHYGAPLSDGWTDGKTVTCPWHCWQFDTSTGQCLSFEGNDVRTYPIRVEDGVAHIDVEVC